MKYTKIPDTKYKALMEIRILVLHTKREESNN